MLEWIQIVEKLGVIWILALVLYFLAKQYIKKDDEHKDQRHYLQTKINELILLNHEHCDNTRKLIEEANGNLKLVEYWKWWIQTHKPTIKLCSGCKDYSHCPHISKPILN